MPRLLPLVAVAIVGVLGINLLAGAQGLPQMFSGARAWAEDVAANIAEAAPEAKAGPLPPGQAAAAPAEVSQAVCAPTEAELAGEAGLSVAELQMLQNLGVRRTELDAREDGFDVQIQLLHAAEEKVDTKIANMETVVAQLQELLGLADAQKTAENERLVKVYETMRPREAAPQLAAMRDEVRLPILAAMNERKLAAILQAMDTNQAKEITEKLADRTTQAYDLDEARSVAADGARTAAAAATPPAATPRAAQAQPATPQAPQAKAAAPATSG